MARAVLNLKISLENIHCYDEGDGLGDAEPYLWVVFFKIDGDGYAYETGAGLIGYPTIASSHGNHGNLNDTDVDAGDDVPIPEAIGVWSNTLKPIPVNDAVIAKLLGEDDLPGICGVAVSLMEQDSWPDNLATTGYSAFINAVTFAVAQVANSFQHALHAPTKEEIDAAIQQVKTTAGTMVHDAVEGAMSGWQTAWFGTFGNNDDQIGTQVWTWTSDDFANNITQVIDQRWKNEGDWEITGRALGVVPCPANALSGLFGGGASGAQKIGPSPHPAITALHDFRAGDFTKFPGLQDWWRALSAGNADFISILAKNPDLKTAALSLFNAAPEVLANPDKKLTTEHLQQLKTILSGISEKSPLLKRSLVRQAMDVLPTLEGKSFNEAITVVSKVKRP